MTEQEIATRAAEKFSILKQEYMRRTQMVYNHHAVGFIDRAEYNKQMKLARAQYLKDWEESEAIYHADMADLLSQLKC